MIEPFKLGKHSFESTRKRGPVNVQPVTPQVAKLRHRRTDAEMLLSESASSSAEAPNSRRKQHCDSVPAEVVPDPCWPQQAAEFVRTGVAEDVGREEREAGRLWMQRALTLERAKEQLAVLCSSNHRLRRCLLIAENVKVDYQRAVKQCHNARHYDTAVDVNSTFEKEVEMMIGYRRQLAELCENKRDELAQLRIRTKHTARMMTVGQKRKREATTIWTKLSRAKQHQERAAKKQRRIEIRKQCTTLETELENAIASAARPSAIKWKAEAAIEAVHKQQAASGRSTQLRRAEQEAAEKAAAASLVGFSG